VYDYSLGKVDWMATGLPTVRADSSQQRALDVADRVVATCKPDERIADVAPRADGASVIVVNAENVVLGRVRANTASDAAANVEDMMEPGPATVRAHEPLTALLERMEKRNVAEVLVTTPEGVLLGAVRRETLAAPSA
jgi:CBS domain-containing protein